ncbi:hypothetical protein G9409_09920 [Chlorobium sp. BLA1]|uniref:hypothetical protein n=1 Tax=Candidatus Chlorobium masyuteum TaxID=2716876 RepID=UPI0014243D1F|nr:hypothetical protein [Candidatus Chlorobium masyuteum]NHQ60889.1 hypothetical protein [Candidatus Chlorobium masyuteum]NTU44174.1 hypothetical protein [Chlorobiaceae bacterium]
MKKRVMKRAVLVSLLSLCLSPSAFADTGDVAGTLKGGTLGLGAEVTVGLTSSINARAGFNTLNYDGSTTESDIKYDYTLKLQSIPLLLDWHPFDASGFRLSSGAVFNSNKVNATGAPQGTYTIGGTTYTTAQIATLSGDVTFNNVSPYAGIGWGNAVGTDSGLSIALDLGVVFQGTPNVSLAASGPIATDATFKTNLAKETTDLESNIKSLKYYPVISLGLAYKF